MLKQKKQFIAPSKFLPLLLLGLTTIGLMVSVYAVQQNQDLRKQAATSAIPGCPPTATAPANNATVTTAPTYSWSFCLNGGDGYYRINISGPGISGTYQTVVQTNSFKPNNISYINGGKYTWFIEACTATTPTCAKSPIKGPTASFTYQPVTPTATPTQVTALPGCPPTAISPANNATVTAPPTFSWSQCLNTGAGQYRINISGPGISGTYQAFVQTTSFKPNNINYTNGGKYSWFVEACSSGSLNCTKSPIKGLTASFTYQPPTPTPTTITCKPTLKSPANNASVNTVPTFSWNPCDDNRVSRYRLNITQNNASVFKVIISGTSYKPTNLNLTSGRKYSWFVEACTNQDCVQSNTASTQRSFTYQPITPTPTVSDEIRDCPPTALSPRNNSVVTSDPTYSWTPCINFWYNKHRINISGPGISGTYQAFTTESSFKPTNISYVNGETYTWFVEACSSGSQDCTVSTIKGAQATFTYQSPITCKPTLKSPANNASVNTVPTFSWNPCDDNRVSRYRLNITQNNTSVFKVIISGTSYKPTNLNLTAGKTYAWFVEACTNQDCVQSNTASTQRSFTYQLPTPTPTSIQPINTKLNFQIKLQGVIHAQNGRKVSMTLLPQESTGTRKDIAAINITPTDKYTQGIYAGTTSIQNIVPGSYNIYIKGNSHLQKLIGTVRIQNTNHTFNWATTEKQLKVGDVVGSSTNTPGDNYIRLIDITTIINKYKALSVPVSAGTPEDVDFSGTITIRDIALVIANYNSIAVPGDTIPNN